MRFGLAARSGVGVLLLLITSCVAPERHEAAKAQVTDTRTLVRQLAPAVSEQDLATLPEAATPTPSQAAVADAPPPFLAQPASVADGERARDCLTAAVYYEARSEPVDGQRAVAQVVLNRVRDRAFPHSVCGVVYQGVRSGKGCQFSFACDGSTLRPREPGAWERAERVAIAALNGGVMAAVGNATFYHAGYVLPWWASSLTRLGAIGSHIFYRWPGAVERALGFRAAYAGIEPGAPGQALGGSVAGVTIIRGEAGFAGGSKGGFGVTVHRGGEAAASVETDPPVIKARPAVFAGVRVHRGGDVPAPTTAEPAALVGA